MQCLARNKRSFYYALYKSQTAVTDTSGNETGETQITYETPVQMYANISASTGTAQAEQFGTSLSYDKVIVTADMSCPIDENSVLWIDSVPDANNTVPYDYIVKKIAKSLNSISIAISKVQVA